MLADEPVLGDVLELEDELVLEDVQECRLVAEYVDNVDIDDGDSQEIDEDYRRDRVGNNHKMAVDETGVSVDCRRDTADRRLSELDDRLELHGDRLGCTGKVGNCVGNDNMDYS